MSEQENSMKNGHEEIKKSDFLDKISSDTMGLAMHNAITNQQQCNVTISASVASTCTRILAVKFKGDNGSLNPT